MLWFTKKSRDIERPKTLGELGELWAQEEYRKRGYSIVSRNEYNKKGKRAGEIDFIATTRDSIAFVEVKTRTSGVDRYGKGAESVNSYKQHKLLKAVKMFLARNSRYQVLRPQIDVCVLEVTSARGYPGKHQDTNIVWHWASNGVDNYQYSVTILENVVEDWN